MQEKPMSENQRQDRKTPSRPQNARPTIGFLVTLMTHPWVGVADMAQERGANLIIFAGGHLRSRLGFGAQGNVLYDLVGADTVDGLVFSGGALCAFVGAEAFRDFCERYRPLPMVSISSLPENIPGVVVDNYQGMREAIIHLVEAHGYRRIAFIHGPEGHQEERERFRAYTDVLREYDIPFDPNLVSPHGFWDRPWGQEAIRVLLDQRQVSFEAVAAANDPLAVDAIGALQARGIRVPYDVGVVGFDDFLKISTMHITPPLTTVPVLEYGTAWHAAKMVLDMLAGEPVPEQVFLPTKVIVRQSCGCLASEIVQAAAGVVTPTGESFEVALTTQREHILSEMAQAVGTLVTGLAPAWIARDGYGRRPHPRGLAVLGLDPGWAGPLLDAFVAELGARMPGAFLPALDTVLRQVVAAEADVALLQGAVSALRRHALPYLTGPVSSRAEDLWQQARVFIGEAGQRAQAYQQVQAEQQAQTLSEIGQALITTLDMKELMDVVARELPRLGIPSCYLSLYENPDAPAEWSRLILAYDEQGRVALEPGGRRFPSRQLVPDGLLPRDRRYSLVAEPLYFREQQLGFVLFELGPHDGAVYETLRGQLSSALKGARLLQQVESHAIQLQTVSEVSRAAQSILSLDELLPQAANLVRERFDLYYVGIFMLDQAGQWAVLRAGTGEAGQQMMAARHKLKVGGSSMIGWCVANRQARIALDVGGEAIRFNNPLLPNTRSEIALPLISRGRVIGAASIQSAQPAAYSPEDVLVFQTMADQLANAIENARLFDERKQAEAQTQETLQELERLYRATIREGWQAFRETAPSNTGYLFDRAGLRPAEDVWAPQIEQAVKQNALVPPSPAPVTTEKGQREAGGVAVAPLSVRGQVIGAVGVYDDPERPLSPEDLALVQEIAEQGALALDSARLFEETRRHAEELTLINRIVAAAASSQDLRSSLDIVAGEMARALSLGHVGIALLNEERTALTVVADHPVGPDGDSGVGIVLPVEGNLSSQQVIATRQPMIIPDAQTSPLTASFHDVARQRGTQTLMILPLIAGNEVIGTFGLDILEPGRLFTPDEMRLAETIVAQTSTAIQNVRLFQEARTHAEEMAVLNQVARTLSTRLNVDQVLQETYRGLSRLMDTTNFFVGLYDPEKNEISFPISASESVLDQQITVMSADQGLTGYIIRNRAPVLIKDDVREWNERMGMETVGEVALSWLGVPLMTGDQVLGVMAVQSYTTPGMYDEHDRDLLTAFASQAAIAIQNARLFEQTRAALAESENLYTTSRRLTTASNLQEIVAAVAEGLRVPAINRVVLMRFDYDDAGDMAAIVSQATWHSGQGTPPTPIGTRYPKGVFESLRFLVSPIPVFFDDIDHDERPDPAMRGVLQRLKIRALAALPLWVGGRQSGVLLLEGEEPHHFTEQEIRSYPTLVGQMAVTVENQRLLKEAQARAERERLVRTITDRVRRSAGTQAILRTALEELGQMLGASTSVARLGTPAQLLSERESALSSQATLAQNTKEG